MKRILATLAVALLGLGCSGEPPETLKNLPDPPKIGVKRQAILTGQCNPVADGTMFQNNPTFGAGADDDLWVSTTTGTSPRRAVLRFNVGSGGCNVPAGSTITSVTLRLNLNRGQVTATTLDVRRLTASFTEGTSNPLDNDGTAAEGGGSGIAATGGDVTWNSRSHSGSAWSSPGGDFSGVSASLSVSGATIPSNHTWATNGNLVNDVQGWLDTPATNFGWIIRDSNEAVAGKSKRFGSRSDGAPPLLTVGYTLPAGATGCDNDNDCTGSLDCVNTATGAACSGCASGVCCFPNTCTPATCMVFDGTCGGGTCDFSNAPNGSACPDGTVCNGNETCQSGSCTAGTAPNCDDTNVCTTDSCDPVLGCQNNAVGNGTPCPDGTVCNGDETCQSGTCSAGPPLDCDDMNPCTQNNCNPASGCQNPIVGNGTPCPDGTVCNGDESCQAGTCQAGTPLVCDDMNECTVDSCDPALGCQVANEPDGTACTPDSLFCSDDVCTGGTCTHPPGSAGVQCRAPSCSVDTAIQAEVCTGSSTTCPGPTMVPCNGNGCNGPICNECTVAADCLPTEFCQAGTCTPRLPNGTVCGAPDNCLSNECVDGVCCDAACGNSNPNDCQACNLGGPMQGICSPLPNASACDDSDACTNPDQCNAGVCGGAVVNCDDSNDCTTDGCDTMTGCTNIPRADGSACLDDGELCTLDECSSGVCTHPAGNAGTVCRTAAGTCDISETCNGALPACPADVFLPAASQCRPPSCTAGVGTLAANCPGSGPACPGVMTQNCTPFVCQGMACGTTCVLDTDCAAGRFCNAGSCDAQLPLGSPCTVPNECSSGFCADGVCCSAGCGGQCEACDDIGSVGTCVPVTGAPHGTRTPCAADGSACDGFCDGANVNACSLPGAATQCRAPSCTGALATLEALCNGTGACPGLQTQDCSPFVCGPTQCAGNCSVDAECTAGNFCRAGVCVPAQPNGSICASNTECQSAACVDGFCCDSTCSGQCEACNQTGTEGTCSPVFGAPVGTRSACATDGSVCGGTCDGTNPVTCALPGAGTECRAASCTADTATLQAFCEGTGSCPTAQTQSCGGLGCTGTICGGGCLGDGDCAASEFCSGGVCVPRQPLGAPCTAAAQCSSGLCADGFCCGTSCLGQCEACDVAGNEGTCVAVAGPPHGSRQPCASDGSVCGGACGGTDPTACTFPDGATICRAASCTADIATLEAGCNGAGACPAGQQQPCTPNICAGTICGGGCIVNGDCTAAEFCAGGVCVPKLPNGSPCGAQSQCVSAFCTDGVCCDSACGQQCEACDIVGSQGTCTPVVGAPRSGRAACTGVGACAATCDGTNAAACTFPGATVACGTDACVGASELAAAPACNGAGTCLTPTRTDCTPFACAGSACVTTCVVDNECAAGLVCMGGACVPPTMPDAGADAGDAGDAATDAPADAPGPMDAGSDAVVMTDAGDAAVPVDGGMGGAAPVDASTDAATELFIDGEDVGSCACRSAGGGHRSSGGALVALGALAWVGMRRRRRGMVRTQWSVSK